MRSRSLFLCTVVVFLLSLLRPQVTRAQGSIAFPQWMEVASFGDPYNPVWPSWYSSFYFFNPTHGVVAITGKGRIEIQYIYNKLGRCYRATIPSGFSVVRSIRFIQGRLYGATDGPDAIVSTDSGRTWKFSGLGLANANDVYADAHGTIRGLRDPMVTIARLDTMHCVATGNGSIFVSKDGGVTWNTAMSGLDPASIGAFADPCRNVFVCPSSWGTALRSTDYGETWRTVITNSGPYSEDLAGASTTTYITNAGGMYRSTDDGLDWTSIITIDAGPHWPMFVFGPMGEHVVIQHTWQWPPTMPQDSLTEVFMTTNGGDDRLHSAIAMTDSNGAPLLQQDTMNVPFQVMSRCDNFKIPVAMWSDVDSMVEHMTIVDSLGDFAVADTTFVVRKQKDDTVWIAYQPHHPVANAILKFDNHWHCSDWSETRSVHVVAIPTADIAPLPVFGANCMRDTEAAVVHMDSCMTLVIDSVSIPSSISGLLHYISKVPDTLRSGSLDSLFLTFDPPDSLAAFFDSVRIVGHYVGLDSTLDDYWYFPHAWGVDTNYGVFYKDLPVRMSSRLQMVLLPQAASITLARPQFCDEMLDTIITLSNEGCARDTLSSIDISGTGFFLTQKPTLPIVIPPDSSIRLSVQFLAPDTGRFTGDISVQGSSGVAKTVHVPLEAIGYPHEGIFSIGMPELEAGSFAICGGLDTVVSDTLWNRGCDTIFVRSVANNNPGSYEILAPTTDSAIAPQSWKLARIRFHPNVKGPNGGVILFASRSAHSVTASQLDTISFDGFGLAGTKSLVASAESLDLDTIYTCETLDTTIWIYNSGCDTLSIDSLRISDSTFWVDRVPPFYVNPLDSAAITIHFTMDTLRHSSGITGGLTLYSNADNWWAMTIPLNVALLYPPNFTLRLEADTAAPAGSTVRFVLVAPGDHSTIQSMRFDLTHDDDLLALLKSADPALHEDSVTRIGANVVHHLTLDPLPIGDTLTEFLFRSYLTRASSTPVSISNVTFETDKRPEPECASMMDSAHSTFTYLYTCGEQLIEEVLTSNSITLDGVRPNPANDAVTVSFKGISDPRSAIDLSICDILGRSVRRMRTNGGLLDQKRMTVPVSDLAEGVYYLRAEIDQGGRRRTIGTRRIVIRRD